MKVVLASASAVRLRTLQQAGIRPEVTVSNVDEGAFVADSPDELAAVLATAKARAVFERLGAAEALVIGCDSVLELDGEALGKPGDAATAAARRLRRTRRSRRRKRRRSERWFEPSR